jgi:hypothetical protein
MEPITLAFKWLKDNWILLLVAAVVAFLAWQNFAQGAMVDSLSRENQEQFRRHTLDLQSLRESHAQEVAAQQEINRQLEENLTRVENLYTSRLAEIEGRLRTRRQVTVRETEGNPDEMARRLRERLGWTGAQ